MIQKRSVMYMVRELVHDPVLLSLPSSPAGKEDLQALQDLLDTLKAHRDDCVGMAGNMIGVRKRIIAFDCEGTYMTMLNPEILQKSEPYPAEESCLSLLGGPRPVKRWKKIKVRWQTETLQTRIRTFTGCPAQIIQHECDHLEGVLI